MRIAVPDRVLAVLSTELKVARRQEIGGVLVAERIGGDQFRIIDLSVQRNGGSSHAFERDPIQHRTFLAKFFDRTGHDYARFNYFGEWHSHPNVPAVPSLKDVQSMHDIVNDPAVNVPFAALLVARRRLFGRLDLSATEFRSDCTPKVAFLSAEHGTKKRRFRDVASIGHLSWSLAS